MILERPEKENPELEIHFDQRKGLVVISGLDRRILGVYRQIYEAKRSQTMKGEIEFAIMQAQAALQDGEPEYQYTFGVRERIIIRRDRIGEYGEPGNALLLYLPNSPPDEEERSETIMSIKQTMKEIGYDV